MQSNVTFLLYNRSIYEWRRLGPRIDGISRLQLCRRVIWSMAFSVIIRNSTKIYIYQSVTVVCQENLTAVNYLTQTQTPFVKTEIRWKDECQRLRFFFFYRTQRVRDLDKLIIRDCQIRFKKKKEKKSTLRVSTAWDQYVSDLIRSRPKVALI